MDYHQSENGIKEFNRCRRCGRKLKKEEYKKLGFGPICLQKMQKTGIKKLFTI